jgi:hypothetical protein
MTLFNYIEIDIGKVTKGLYIITPKIRFFVSFFRKNRNRPAAYGMYTHFKNKYIYVIIRYKGFEYMKLTLEIYHKNNVNNSHV